MIFGREPFLSVFTVTRTLDKIFSSLLKSGDFSRSSRCRGFLLFKNSEQKSMSRPPRNLKHVRQSRKKDVDTYTAVEQVSTVRIIRLSAGRTVLIMNVSNSSGQAGETGGQKDPPPQLDSPLGIFHVPELSTIS